MTTETEQVLERAVGLSPIQRAELVEKILSSFDFPSRAALDAAWAREAESRIDAFDRGEITVIPASKVFEKVENPDAS